MNEFEAAMQAGIVSMPMPGMPEVETPPAAPPPTPAPQAPPPAPIPNPLEAQLAQMQREMQQMQQRYQEADETARYWAEMAQRSTTAPEAPAAPAPAPQIDPEQFAADLSRRGPAALEGMFLTPQQAQAMIREEATRIANERAAVVSQATLDQITFHAQMSSEFPELKPGTPFFNEAVIEARKLAQFDPSLKDSNALMVAGAGIVKARREATAAAEATRVTATNQQEQQRLQQVAAQTGPMGSGSLPASTGTPMVISPLTNMFFREVAGGEINEADMNALKAGNYVPQSRRAK